MIKKTALLLLALLLVVSSVGGVLAEEKPQLQLLMEYTNNEPNSDPTAALLESLTGYKVQYDALPGEERIQKLNAIIAAQEPYDMMVIAPDAFSKTVQSGAYLPLDELLESHGKDILAGADKELWTSTTVDGQIMGIPYRLSYENYNSGLRVRTDLLEQIGITQMPTTPDELYDVLTKVKNELGIIPLTGRGTDGLCVIPEIASAFGLYSQWIATEEGIQNRMSTPGAKAYVEYMTKLFNEGLIDSEWAQNTNETAKEKFLSGKALINRVYWWEEPAAAETLLANFPEATFEYLPPLTGEFGSGIELARTPDRIVVMPAASKNPEAAMEWMNTKMSTTEIFRELCIGTEGVHYNVIGENEYEPINPAFADEKGYASEFLTGTIAKDYDIYWAQTRVRKNESLYKEFVKMQDNIKTATIYYDPTSFMPPNAEFLEASPSLVTFLNDTVLQIIVGTKSIDQWDEMLSEYQNIGGQEVEQLLNTWWTEHKEELQDKIHR